MINADWFMTRTEKRSDNAWLFAIVFAYSLALRPIVTVAEEPQADRFAKWEPAIRKFEQQDAENPPAKGGIVFVGGSIVQRWDLPRWFGKPGPLNRGMSGSQIIDVIQFANQLVLKHQPRLIVFYSGDNDIAAGVSGADVADRYQQFCKLVHAELPKTRIIIVSVKPSPARWRFAKEQQAANAGIVALCAADKRIEFVDVWPSMLDSNGQARDDLLVKDNLHLNNAGYKLWTDKLKPLLSE